MGAIGIIGTIAGIGASACTEHVVSDIIFKLYGAINPDRIKTAKGAIQATVAASGVGLVAAKAVGDAITDIFDDLDHAVDKAQASRKKDKFKTVDEAKAWMYCHNVSSMYVTINGDRYYLYKTEVVEDRKLHTEKEEPDGGTDAE